MVELYKMKPDGKPEKIQPHRFADEPKDLEDFIKKNEEILGDNVALLSRQITIPGGRRIDLWGLDALELRPVIIELKNTTTGDEIISQILPYYKFVKSHPDTLKYNAIKDKEYMKKLKELGVDATKLENELEKDPKVILIAPSFSKDLLDVVDYITFEVQLLELSRHKTKEGDSFVVINKLQPTPPTPVTVRAQEQWNWEKYQQEGISKNKIEIAEGLKKRIDTILRDENINLQPIFRKLYIPYQSGRNNVFWIDVGYTSWKKGDVLLTLKLDKKPDLKAENIAIKHTKIKWLEKYKQYSIFFDEDVDLSPLTPIIKRSYEYVIGE